MSLILSTNYFAVWDRIKKTGSADITVSKEHARTVENGVKRIKTAENVARRQAGLVGWSKLVVSRQEISKTHVKIQFKLLYLTAL
jgi:hypothetical protein